MNDTEIRSLLEGLAHSLLGRVGVGPRLAVRGGEDSEGDPVLFVDVLVEEESTIKDARRLLHFKLRARDLLESENETRFPIFSFILASEHDKHAAA
jgi:hypothetical protein